MKNLAKIQVEKFEALLSRYSSSSRLSFLILTVSLLAFLLVQDYGTVGLRGTDQYWYVADATTLAEGRGPFTNVIFPIFLRNQGTRPFPFLHDGPPLRLAAAFARVVGDSYRAWVLLNAMSMILVVFLLFAILRHRIESVAASLIAAIFVFLPNTSWLSMQPLSEVSILPFVLIFLWVISRVHESQNYWLFASVVAGVLVLCREDFMVLALLFPFLYIAWARCNWQRPSLKLTLVLMTGTIIAILFSKYFFPTSMVTFRAVMQGRAAGLTGMAPYFDPLVTQPSVDMFLAVGVAGLLEGIVPTSGHDVLFFLPFNLLAAGLLWFLLISKRPLHTCGDALVLFAIVQLLTHFLTSFLYNTQARYTLIATPVLLIAVAQFAHDRGLFKRHRISAYGISVVTLVAFLILTLQLADHSRGSSREEAEIRRLLRRCLAQVPQQDTILVEGVGNYLLVAYVLAPRTTVFFRPNSQPRSKANCLVEKTRAKWLFASAIPEGLRGWEIQPAGCNALPDPFTTWQLYAIDLTSTPSSFEQTGGSP